MTRTDEKKKARAKQKMRKRLERWTVAPPKQRTYPKSHPWRTSAIPKCQRKK